MLLLLSTDGLSCSEIDVSLNGSLHSLLPISTDRYGSRSGVRERDVGLHFLLPISTDRYGGRSGVRERDVGLLFLLPISTDRYGGRSGVRELVFLFELMLTRCIRIVCSLMFVVCASFLIIVVFFIILCARLFKLVCARCLNFTYGRLGRCGCWVASECSRLRLGGCSRLNDDES